MANNFRRGGVLRERLHFQVRPSGDDGWGTPVAGSGDFVTQFTQRAGMRPRIGGEAVTAARLTGVQPYVVTVRHSPQMKDVTTAWRLVDARDERRFFNVVAPPADPDGTNKWLEILVTEGVAS